MGITRRDFVLGAGAAVGAAAAGLLGFPEPASGANPADPYVTCFYQFTPASLTALGKSGALPDGPGYVHIFTQSTPGEVRHPNTARSVHALGESFLYGPAFDLHKYEGWRTASDAQIKEWAEKFREEALDSSGPADFFAFNEMPVMGSTLPDVRVQVAKICRALHGAGGGPKLRGVFYFTEHNLNPAYWPGDADDFWDALDATCDLVVGEHYHDWGFVMGRSREALSDHLFALPKALVKSGKPAQVSIAEHKYAVLHSSYYGPNKTGWEGLQTDRHDPHDLEAYFQRTVDATRQNPFGRRRISFGPLATRQLDNRLLAPLARVLRKDARQRV